MTLYENEETLKAETKLKEKIEQVSGFIYRKLPIQFELDFAATDETSPTIHHWAEAKCRDFAHTEYDTYLLSFQKVMMAEQLSRLTGIPSYLFLGFTDDVIMRCRLDDVTNWAVEWGGRTIKTRRNADIHPIVKIPRDWFERVV